MSTTLSFHIANVNPNTPKPALKVEHKTCDNYGVAWIQKEYFHLIVRDGEGATLDLYLNPEQVIELTARLSSCFREWMDGTPDAYRDGAYDTEGRTIPVEVENRG